MVDDTPDPRDYPWAEPARAGLLHRDGFLEDDGPEGLRGRTPVVAVGSNAAPGVLARKLGSLLATGLPVRTARVDGLHVGHSAHVSAGGYVAAAPAAGTTVQQVTVCWFDAAQLAQVDRTEPNYRRVPLPVRMACRLVRRPGASGRAEDGPVVPHAQIYESVHGVLGEGGQALALRDQAGVLAWLATRLPRHVGPWLDHDRLVDPDVRERVRLAMLGAGLVLTSPLDHPGDP